MITKIFKLSFKTPVHFGKKRLSDGEMTIKADTLFSALYTETLNLGKQTNWLMNDLIISDTFPYESELYYLPKPLIKIESNSEGNHKDFKKLKYVPVYNYNDYIKGQLSEEDVRDLNDIFRVGQFSLQTKVSLKAQEQSPNADSEPYSVGTFSFEKDAGLYFIAKGSERTIQRLNEVMYALQFSGIGGKRSAGYGRFEYTCVSNENISNLLNQDGDNFILLSTSMAKREELEASLNKARYILSKRTGFIQSTTYSDRLVKKNDFYSFSVGSVFKTIFKGDIFNVGNQGQHPVYRYAKPLWMEV